MLELEKGFKILRCVDELRRTHPVLLAWHVNRLGEYDVRIINDSGVLGEDKKDKGPWQAKVGGDVDMVDGSVWCSCVHWKRTNSAANLSLAIFFSITSTLFHLSE